MIYFNQLSPTSSARDVFEVNWIYLTKKEREKVVRSSVNEAIKAVHEEVTDLRRVRKEMKTQIEDLIKSILLIPETGSIIGSVELFCLLRGDPWRFSTLISTDREALTFSDIIINGQDYIREREEREHLEHTIGAHINKAERTRFVSLSDSINLEFNMRDDKSKNELVSELSKYFV